ncbi:JAB domain-containing protein [Paraflavisolibacter sp. H34]|uniref:JAB domain-containing protein n=1 Tax=Huijunlia imazamoxiresistens TaxID=3127457 RepID=UPI0030182F07
MKKKLLPFDTFQVAEVELVYRSKVKASDRPQIITSYDAYQIFLQNWDPGKIELLEQFRVLYLNRASRVLGLFHASSGGITGTVADPRLILATALRLNAVSLLLSHNHPSGALQPSQADRELTTKIRAAGMTLDIRVLDHLIISCDGYFSFADEGLL